CSKRTPPRIEIAGRISGGLITMREWFVAAVLAAMLSAPAMAADAVTSAEPAATWSGCHVGAVVGFVYGTSKAVDLPFVEGPFVGSGVSWNSPPGPANETFSADDTSMILGGQVGCDYEVQLGGVGLVFGAATDISALRLSGTGTSGEFSDVHNSFDV